MCCPDGGPSKIVAISPPGSAFSIGTTVSAPAGIGAPVAMRTASPPPTTASGRRPIRALPTIFSSIGDAGRGTGHIGGADGEPVHRGRRELREIAFGDHVLRDHAPVRLGERELQRRERVDLRQDVPPRILDGEQPADVVVIVDVAVLGHGRSLLSAFADPWSTRVRGPMDRR